MLIVVDAGSGAQNQSETVAREQTPIGHTAQEINPLDKPKEMPVREEFDMKPTPAVKWLGVSVILATLVLYAIFW